MVKPYILMFHLSLTSHRVRLHKAGRGGQSLVLMVRLQRKQTSTGDVRQREERGEGSMLEEGDGAGAAGQEGSRSSFDCIACGRGGSRRGAAGRVGTAPTASPPSNVPSV